MRSVAFVAIAIVLAGCSTHTFHVKRYTWTPAPVAPGANATGAESTPAQRMEPAPFSQRVLDAAKQVKEQSGIDGDPILLNTRDPRYSDYFQQIQRMIQAKMGYPCVKDAASGHCDYKSTRLVIVFGILKDGRVPALAVAEPADYATYDAYSVNAIKLASPFPPVPDAMVNDRTGVLVVTDFKYVYSPAAPAGTGAEVASDTVVATAEPARLREVSAKCLKESNETYVPHLYGAGKAIRETLYKDCVERHGYVKAGAEELTVKGELDHWEAIPTSWTFAVSEIME